MESEWTALKKNKTIEAWEQHKASAAHAQSMMTRSVAMPAHDPLTLNYGMWHTLPSLALNYVQPRLNYSHAIEILTSAVSILVPCTRCI